MLLLGCVFQADIGILLLFLVNTLGAIVLASGV